MWILQLFVCYPIIIWNFDILTFITYFFKFWGWYAFCDQNYSYRLKCFLNGHFLNTKDTTRQQNPERAVVSEMLAPALLSPTIIPHSKPLKYFILSIFTITSVITTSSKAQSSRCMQPCSLTSFYVTVGLVYFQIRGVTNFLTTQCI